MADQSSSELARAIQDVTEKAQLLVREEIELAKAEMTYKVTKLIKGAIFGVVAGVFAVFALIYLLHALSWGINDVLDVSTALWAGFLITGALLLLLGLIAGLVARMLVPGDVFRNMSGPTSWLASIALGLAGAIVGYLIFTVGLGIGDTDVFDLGGLVSAIIGTVIVLLVVGVFVRRRGPTRL
jgi:uncharacterized membrane protein YeaQ/YmgE (transglycosylase-associated protein family)